MKPIQDTISRYIYFDSPNLDGEAGHQFFRLMLAANDLTLVNQTFGDWQNEEDRFRGGRKRYAKIYFFRLACAHLSEAMDALEELVKLRETDNLLSKQFESLDEQSKKDLDFLSNYFHGGARMGWFGQQLCRQRNATAFHYLESEVEYRKLLSSVRKSFPNGGKRVQRGGSNLGWHFEIADALLEFYLLNRIWQLPLGTSAEEVDEQVITEVNDLVDRFLDVSTELIWLQFRSD